MGARRPPPTYVQLTTAPPATGRYAKAGKLPRRDVLAAEFDVSHATITKASALLREEGLVVYAPGRGLLIR